MRDSVLQQVFFERLVVTPEWMLKNMHRELHEAKAYMPERKGGYRKKAI